MSPQAVVTLTATTLGIIPPKRILKLNLDRQCVPIGRASKSVSKGLVGAVDNAWFDNPVMSRDHAELSFCPDDMSIMIRDTRSMHGTLLNDSKLPHDTLHRVKRGDVLSFGAEVRRGPETFPPCAFKIDYDFPQWTRSFQFPESSDVEDEQDLWEDDDVVHENSRECDVTPVESPLANSAAVDAIDLTKEDSAPVEDTSRDPVADSHDIIPSGQEKDTQSTGRVENPIILEDISSDEAEESESQNEKDSEQESDSDKENYDETDEEPEEVVEESIYDWEGSEARVAESNQDPSMVSQSNSEAYLMPTHMYHDNRDIPVSSLRSTVNRLPEAIPQESGEPQESYSRNDDGWDDAEFEEDPENKPNDHVVEGLDSHQLPLMGQDASGSTSVNGPALGSFMLSTSSTTLAPNLLGHEQTVHRQPSPSDAAMAKSFTKESAQSLGDKTGKHDFFQAREINRARVNDEGFRFFENQFMGDGVLRTKFNQLGNPYNPRPHVPPSQTGMPPQVPFYPQNEAYQHLAQQQQQIAAQRQIIQQRLQQQMVAQQQHLQQQMVAQRFAQPLMAQPQPQIPSHCFGFVSPPYSLPTGTEQPACQPSPVQSAGPELDMTSAVKYNQSKLLIAAQAASSQPSRSAVRIDDIVEPPVAEPTPRSLKRKAPEISDVLEEEARVWAEKDSSIPVSAIESALDATASSAETAAQSVMAAPVEGPVSTDAPARQPPSKKLKRFAENVAYFTLGGIALSAGLFSVLVKTAPEFLDI